MKLYELEWNGNKFYPIAFIEKEEADKEAVKLGATVVEVEWHSVQCNK